METLFPPHWFEAQRMPGLSFEMPHWLYWATLILLPLVIMVMARRTAASEGERDRRVGLAYFIWLAGGILGLHRFYLKNLWGLLYLPLFIAILYANGQGREARSEYSTAANIVSISEDTIERETGRIASAEASLPELKAAIEEAEQGTFAKRGAEKKLKRAEDRIVSSRERIETAKADLETAKPTFESAGKERDYWRRFAFFAFAAILAFMALDFFLIPFMTRRANRKPEDHAHDIDPEIAAKLAEVEPKKDEDYLTKGWTGFLDRLSFYSGEFVSYWAVIAVFVYYFEVVARYVFNSPTNWAHEGMFLMFGMQYLIAGSYAMLTESHVRVDIFYAKFSTRGKAIIDILTSIFFFLFAGVLLVTCWIFAMDATTVSEISVTEWQIAYWPFKWAMVIGALLLILQGIAKLTKDMRVLATGEPPDDHHGGAAGMREAA